MNRVLAGIFLILILAGCRAKKQKVVDQARSNTENPVVNRNTSKNSNTDKKDNPNKPPKKHTTYTETVADYITAYSAIAKEEMLQYGIPASITLAQGILESGSGKGRLAREGNNHFGIKCHSGWKGKRIFHDDDKKGECFRKYKEAKYSYRDHSLFLSQRKRYQALFALKKDDYKAWARGLKKAGYATDPKYANKLIALIERFNLQEFDQDVLGRKPRKKNNEKQPTTYIVKAGDTLYSIARKYHITVAYLKQYNGITNNLITVGQTLYIPSIKN